MSGAVRTQGRKGRRGVFAHSSSSEVLIAAADHGASAAASSGGAAATMRLGGSRNLFERECPVPRQALIDAGGGGGGGSRTGSAQLVERIRLRTGPAVARNAGK